MNLFFLIDEYTDVKSAPVVQEMIDVVIDALHNPHKTRPEGEVVLGKAAKEMDTNMIVWTPQPTLQGNQAFGMKSWEAQQVKKACSLW